MYTNSSTQHTHTQFQVIRYHLCTTMSTTEDPIRLPLTLLLVAVHSFLSPLASPSVHSVHWDAHSQGRPLKRGELEVEVIGVLRWEDPICAEKRVQDSVVVKRVPHRRSHTAGVYGE